jgi:stage III sporulation protein AH
VKMNMIIGKKQIVLASLVLILGIAIYLNWQFANSDDALGVADILGGNSTGSQATYGEAELVNTDDNYFANARLEKQKTRDAATETLAGLLEKTDLSAEEKASATAQALQTAQLMESETTIENLVKAKGFEDCIAYLDSENAKVVVKSEELDAAQAAQIKDIIVSETAVDPSNIVVTPVK